MSLKGLGGKADGIVAQNLDRERGEVIPRAACLQGVPTTFKCPWGFVLPGVVTWNGLACGVRPSWNPGPAQHLGLRDLWEIPSLSHHFLIYKWRH